MCISNNARWTTWKACRLFLALVLAVPASGQLGPCTIETVAGGRTFVGVERPALEAELFTPLSMRTAPDGSLYIADTFHNVIRRITPEGVITTVAGTGVPRSSGDGGPAIQAEMYEPRSLAFGPDGSYYFVESRRVRRVSPDGIITTVAGDGSDGLGPDGLPATETSLPGAEDVTVDAAGNIYISSPTAHRVWKVTPDGIAHRFAGKAHPPKPRGGFSGDGGPASEAELDRPNDLAVDAEGNLYIADWNNRRIRRVNTAGIIETYLGGGSSNADGTHRTESFVRSASSIETDGEGRLYWQEGLVMRRLDTEERLETVFETIDNFLFLDIFSVSPTGQIHVSRAHQVFALLPPTGFQAVAGGDFPTPRGEGGLAVDSVLGNPRGLTANQDGEIYIADSGFARVWRFTPGDRIERILGTGFFQFSGDGGLATSARTLGPRDVALDSAGNLYVLARGGRIRKVDEAGVVSTFAGTGEGFRCTPFLQCGEGGPALEAELPEPINLAIDSQDDVFVLHQGQHATPSRWIRRIDTKGIIQRIPLDGIAEQFLTWSAYRFTISPTDRIFVALWRSNAPYYQADPDEEWTPLSGSRNFAGLAQVLAADSTGNLYFSDEIDSISRLTPDGTVNTIAGGNGMGFSGDGGPATEAQLYGPVGMVLAGGDLYFSDFGSRRIRRINDVNSCPSAAVPQVAKQGVFNGASFSSAFPAGFFPQRGLAPGTIFTLFGARLGPDEPLSARIESKARLTTELGGTRVLVDGIPAPMVFTSATQVSAIVPYGIDFSGALNEGGRFVPKEPLPVRVEYQGILSDSEPISPVPHSPGIFTSDGSGKGLAAALNQDGSVNGPFNPAPVDTVIVLFATGAGRTDPPSIDGEIAVEPLPKPLIDVEVLVGGQPAQVLYAGAAPGLTAGVLQINVFIPADFEGRGPVPVQLVMGQYTTDPANVAVIIGE